MTRRPAALIPRPCNLHQPLKQVSARPTWRASELSVPSPTSAAQPFRTGIDIAPALRGEVGRALAGLGARIGIATQSFRLRKAGMALIKAAKLSPRRVRKTIANATSVSSTAPKPFPDIKNRFSSASRRVVQNSMHIPRYRIVPEPLAPLIPETTKCSQRVSLRKKSNIPLTSQGYMAAPCF